MRLISFNYTQQNETTLSSSSQNVNFPASNIKHEFRSKQWRSSFNGNFEITTTNKIDFKEASGGPELTATVLAGTYSGTTLAAAIKSALEAVGAETYSVSKSETTGLWTISSSGTFFSLLNLTGTNQANSILKSALGFANTDRTGFTSYTGANIAIHTSEWIKFDLRTTEEVNSVVLLWPKEDGVILSDTSVIRVQANSTDEWSSPAVNQVLTISDKFEIASHYFTTDQTHRYWRVVIEDPKNPYLYVNLGVVIFGKSDLIENPDNGFVYSLNDNSRVTTTEYGQRYTDEYPIFAELQLNFNNMDYSTASVFVDLFYQVGVRKPVFVVMDPDATIFGADAFAIYGKFHSQFGLSHVVKDIFSSGLVISEIA